MMRKSLWSLSLLFGTLGALTAANAGTICTVPNSVTLNILPTGCGAFLTNGPILYTGVLATGGDIFNIEVDSVELFGLNTAANTINVFIQGISTDITASTVANFSNLSTSTFFQTVPLNNGYAVDTGTQTFPIAHFIDTLPGVFTLKLNFGEAGKPDQSAFDVVTSSATSGPGVFNVSSFFDVYTELTLNGGTNYTVANNDFVGSDRGPGSQFALQNAPEPASAALLSSGLLALCLARRRKVRRISTP